MNDVELNLSSLREIADGNQQFISAILEKVYSNLQTYTEEIIALFRANRLEEMGKMAHKLKSSTVYLGSRKLDEVLNFLEKTDKASFSSQEIASKIDELCCLLPIILKKIEKEIAKLK
ncbi:MAG: hypothetical protein NZM38_10755 [Cytophagales bacterium]|nr:hypothetical protein [Cytophagales bacterium]MDW8385233.1 hypothetical protein [Flammeovirgaceae bacterium]